MMILIWGSLLGFISVAFGAYAEHGLRAWVTDEHFQFILTAVRYNQVYAVVITVIGLVLLNDGKLATSALLKWSGLLFIVGTVLFSFSIYFAVLLNIPIIMKITPLGGTTIMVAWLLLLLTGFVAKKKPSKLL